MTKSSLRNDVSYGALTQRERRLKAPRDLFEIFFVKRNCGLTMQQIAACCRDLNMKGYAGNSIEDVVRGNLHKWNKMAPGLRVVRHKVAGTKGAGKFYLEEDFARAIFPYDPDCWGPGHGREPEGRDIFSILSQGLPHVGLMIDSKPKRLGLKVDEWLSATENLLFD